MAWQYLAALNDLVLTYDGEDHDISPAYSAQLYDDEKNAALANPLVFGQVSKSARKETDPTTYDQYVNKSQLGYGTVELSQFISKPSGFTIKVWRRSIGPAFYFILTHDPSNYQFTVAMHDPVGGTVSMNSNLTYPHGTTLVWYVGSLFFMIDSVNGYAAVGYLKTHENYNGTYHTAYRYTISIQANSNSTRNSLYRTLYPILSNNVPPTPPTPSTDPYADGGYSTGTDTGTGTFDDTSESVGLPTTYSLSATAAGLISQYVLTEAELAAFGSWLWNGGSIFDDLKHFFQSPMEAIFSVGMLPFTPSDVTNYNVFVGTLDANVTGKLVGDTIEKIDMGTIDFDGYYGSALDYNPYTKIEIFLPYCGNFALNPDEVMGHTIGVEYYCDSLTGDCVAFIYDEERVLYQVKGNCFVQIPLAARDFSAQYASGLGSVGTIAAGLAAASVAKGGMTAPIAVGMGTSVAANAMNAKAHIARAGGVSGMAGFMSVQNPYVIMTIPNQCLPELQADHQGYPLFVTKALKEFSGFTKVYEIHLDGLDCTDAEMKEIYELLKGGVIL